MKNDIRFQTLNGQSLYQFSDQNGAKTIPFGAVYIYSYIRGLHKGVLPRAVLTAEMMFIHMIR